MPAIKAILFDFGKVLTLAPNQDVWARIQQLTGLPEPLLQERYWGMRDDYDEGLLTGDVYWESIAGRLLTRADLEKLQAADVDLWTDMNTPMLEWVGALHAAGFRTGILSNMPDAMADGICSRFDWVARFDHTIWSHALKLRKPQPEIYLRAIEGLHTPPENILFIDDKAENIAAAETAGMQTVLYSDHDAFVREMNSRGLGVLLTPSKALLPAL